MLVHCRVPENLLGFPKDFSVPPYTTGWREQVNVEQSFASVAA